MTMISGWGYGEKELDDAVQGGVGSGGGVVLWRNRVRGEEVRNNAVDGRLRGKRRS